MNTFKLKIIVAIVFLFSGLSLFAEHSLGQAAAKKVITRLAGTDKAANVIVKIKPDPQSNPAYTYYAKNGKVYINATTPVAACRGFYDYLRKNHMGMVGWRGPVLRIPQKWPDSPEIKIISPFKFNQMYNVVTAGYSFPYWNWERWQKELDWLALHGYNMILAPIATEAIAERVWKKLGLTQKEIDDFVCGPAHAPWHRMGNIAKVDGPLPPEWHRDQVALQHKLLKRMNALEITPVFQCFAGFLPQGMKRLYPNETYYVTHWNGGFRNERAPIYIMPDSPLFKKILTMYINEWEKEFGKGKYYLIDTFNELKNLPGKPGESLKDIMADYGKNLSSMLSEINPDAVWALQGWIFYYQRKMWKPEVVKALLSGVSNDKMLIFDMMGVWKNVGAYYGKPWIYGMITNMGGKIPYAGDLKRYIRGPQKVIDSVDKGNNVGNSNHSEGVETNAVNFELIADTGWFTGINLDKWLKNYCINRYGSCPDSIWNAWMKLKKLRFSSQKWNSHLGWQKGIAKNQKKFSTAFMAAAKEFLSVHKQFKNSPFYVDDAVEIASFVLSQKADEFYDAASESLNKNDRQAYKYNLEHANDFLLKADRLLESHSLNRLERWVGFARSHSSDKKLQNYYEENAKRIITSWGPPVNDYSARIWSGLLRDFYVPRMQAYFNAKAKGKGFDKHEKNAWESKWILKPGIYNVKPYKDPTGEAYKIVCKAISMQPQKSAVLSADRQNSKVIGKWNPGIVSEKWITLEWPIDESIVDNITGVKFSYTKGHHRLSIKSAELVCDGISIGKDVHAGMTGLQNKNNIYIFRVPKGPNANNGAFIRAIVKSDGGTNSYGKVELLTREK